MRPYLYTSLHTPTYDLFLDSVFISQYLRMYLIVHLGRYASAPTRYNFSMGVIPIVKVLISVFVCQNVLFIFVGSHAREPSMQCDQIWRFIGLWATF